MLKTLIIGFGNLDRQDDGVAWHVLARLSRRYDRTPEPDPDVGMEPQGLNPDFFFTLQLTPEAADLASRYERLCFVDAHTGRVPADIQLTAILPAYQNSPFTHHMTPETLLALMNALNQRQPRAILASIRGYEFGFSRTLSPQTERLAGMAVDRILSWVEADDLEI
jgi:hydrogenase maturation protease